MASRHLDDIIARHNQIFSAQVVGVDIEKYSKRRTLTQVDTVEAFTRCVQEALSEIASENVDYAQQNDFNFADDIVRLPTGDGVFVCFSFEGLPDIHLSFAQALLRHIHGLNTADPCERFEKDGWCNCHPNHNVRIGIAEGKSVIYRDVNGGYNVAGEPMNLAARIMAVADRNQILLSQHAYSQIVDLVDDPALADEFRALPNVRIKHDLRITVHQYIGSNNVGLNTGMPQEIAVTQEMEEAAAALGGPFVVPQSSDRIKEGRVLTAALRQMADMQSSLERLAEGATSEDDDNEPSKPA